MKPNVHKSGQGYICGRRRRHPSSARLRLPKGGLVLFLLQSLTKKKHAAIVLLRFVSFRFLAWFHLCMASACMGIGMVLFCFVLFFSITWFHLCMSGGMSTASSSGCASRPPALSARVPIVSYRTIRLLVWYLARAAAKHLVRDGTEHHHHQGEITRQKQKLVA